jgi:hypothetical protein
VNARGIRIASTRDARSYILPAKAAARVEANQLITLASSELVFLLTRSSDMLIAFKAPVQRTPAEQLRVKRGLIRSLLLEATIFVPASAVLVALLAPLVGFHESDRVLSHAEAGAALLGVISYGFPFGALKRMAQRMALSTLKEFAVLHNQPADLELQKVSLTKTEGE